MCKLVCKWTFLGFVTVLFIGPLLALVASLLPFALLGCGLWAGVHVLLHGRRSPVWRAGLRAQAVYLGATGAVSQSLSHVAGAVCAFGRPLKVIALEVLSGCLLGLLVVLLRATEAAPARGEVFAGVALGGVVGLLVAVAGLRGGQRAWPSADQAG
jgi:hypothetical protein